MENFITLFLVVLGIGFIGEIINNVLFNNKQIKKSKIRSNENIYREKTLMTNTEKNFYQKLKVLEPKYKIIMKNLKMNYFVILIMESLQMTFQKYYY